MKLVVILCDIQHLNKHYGRNQEGPDPLLTHCGLDSGKVWLWQAGGRCAVGGVNGWVSRDGGGATSTVRILNVPAAIAAGATTLLQPADKHAEPQFRQRI